MQHACHVTGRMTGKTVHPMTMPMVSICPLLKPLLVLVVMLATSGQP